MLQSMSRNFYLAASRPGRFAPALALALTGGLLLLLRPART
jgi:hypothetical protein